MAKEENEYVEDDVVEENENEESVNEEESQAVSYEDFKALQEEKERMAKYLEKANKEAKNYRLKAKDYEEIGMSPEEIKELREKQDRAKQRELEKKGDWEKLKSQLTEQFEQERQQYESQLTKMKKSMETTLVQKEVLGAISKHEGIPTLLEPHVKSAVQLVEEEDGSMVPRVIDSDGSPRFNTKGDYMSVDEYVASLREHEDFGVAFRGRQASGSGSKSSSSTGGQRPVPKKKRSEMDMNDKRAFMKEYGIDEYEKLPL